MDLNTVICIQTEISKLKKIQKLINDLIREYKLNL